MFGRLQLEVVMRLALVPALLLLTACGSARPNADPASQGTSRTSEDWKGSSATTVEELFAGRFPGVQVFSANGGISVRVRGGSSINGSNEPLYVVDGITIEPGPGGALIGINPQDVAKIEVLKDVGSTAIYGVRGANGVILITTRKSK